VTIYIFFYSINIRKVWRY